MFETSLTIPRKINILHNPYPFKITSVNNLSSPYFNLSSFATGLIKIKSTNNTLGPDGVPNILCEYFGHSISILI